MNDKPASFDSILASLIEAQEQAKHQPVDVNQWTEKYPQYAAQIHSFFANRGKLEEVLGPRAVVDVEAATIGGNTEAGQGQRIRYFGDYELLSEIARGGMGVVFKARQVSLNRVVAVKMILSGNLADPSDVQRFQAEAEAAANLDHPHIVPIYEVGEHEGQHYFSMKLIEGSSLSAAQNNRPKNESPKEQQRWAAALVAQVAKAVHHAHQRGILHRDLKPGNILLDAEGEPHVTDFGLAKKVEGGSDLTNTGAIVGTPAYMAPEQARCEKGLSTAVDVYSLGAILYELLTGRPPFKADSPLDTILEVLEKEPARPSSIVQSVDRDLETITLKCLEKNATQRYGSTDALAEELARWCRGEPILARPITTFERTIKWAKRRPAIAALIGVSSLAAILLLAGLTVSVVLISNALQAETTAKNETLHALDREKQTGYYRLVAFAQSEWQANDVQRANELLEECPESLRQWEWRYLKRQCHAESLTLRGGGKGLYCETLDESTNMLVVTNVITGEKIFTLKDPPPEIGTASRDWKLYVRVSENGLVVLNTKTNQVLKTLQAGNSKIGHVLLSANSTYVAGTVPSAKVPTHHSVKLWACESGKELFTLDAQDSIYSLAFSPDEQLLAIGLWSGKTKVVKVDTGKELCVLFDSKSDSEGRAEGISFSPDGQRLAVAGHGVRIFDVNQGTLLNTFHGHPNTALCVTFHPAGKLIASGGYDRVVLLWDTETGKEKFRLRGHGDSITEIAFDESGDRLVSRGESIKVWDISKHPEYMTLAGAQGPIAYSPDGKWLAALNKEGVLTIWDAASHVQKTVLFQEELSDDFRCIEFSPDSRFLVAGTGQPRDDEGEIQVWDTSSGKLIWKKSALPGVVHRVSYTPDGKTLAAALRKVYPDRVEGDVWVLDAKTGAEKMRFRQHTGVMDLAISPDGRHSASLNSIDQKSFIKVWELRTGNVVYTLDASDAALPNEKVRQQVFCNIAYSPNGKILATSTSSEPVPGQNKGNSTIQLWDAATGKLLKVTREHTADLIIHIAFTPDGARMVSIDFDGNIRFWNPLTGDEVFTIRSEGGQLTFRPDGQCLAVGNDGSVIILSAEPLTTKAMSRRPSPPRPDSSRIKSTAPLSTAPSVRP
ncbi:MAG TPA: serine/threonine-protein kinase [Gemmatales bacterium]|nr:serine/threonine-protein kinase [Gemmatales bacterium]